ncbi:MAG: putative zinc ribbon domain protein [Verrucomicrobiales bacterium]|nr:putative zinc ribbon domain protein [Verrucomicrobiales bacterium]
MLPEIEQLLILQDKDQHLRRLRAEIQKMPADAENAKGRLASITAAVASAKEEVTQNEIAIRSLELQIQTRRDTIVRLKTQQFETRKNDEFAALAHEVKRYEGDVSKLEDSEMELMEKGEILKAGLKEAQARLATTEADVKEELGKIKERYLNVKARIKEFETIRAGLAAKVDEDLLAGYDRILAGKGEVIAELNGHVCAGCHMRVTAATFNDARAERVITHCPNCGRIVYIAHWDD